MSEDQQVVYESDYNAVISKECNEGLDYYYGTNGVERDLEKAYNIFQALGDKGDLDACVQLGCMYFLGHFVEQSAVKARFWWEKAESHDEALYGLGMIYHQGAEGIPQDSAKAIEYWERASDMLNEAATAALYKFYKNRPKKEKIIKVHQITNNVVNHGELVDLKSQLNLLQENIITLEYSFAERVNAIQMHFEDERNEFKNRIKKSEALILEKNKLIEKLLDRLTNLEKLQVESRTSMVDQVETFTQNFNNKIEQLETDDRQRKTDAALEKLANRFMELDKKQTEYVNNINSRVDLLTEDLFTKMNTFQSNVVASTSNDTNIVLPTNQLDTLMAKFDTMEKKMENEQARIRHAITELNSKNESLEKRVERLEENLENYQVKHDNSIISIRNIQETVSILSRSRHETKKDFNSRLDSLSNRIADLEKKATNPLMKFSSSESIDSNFNKDVSKSIELSEENPSLSEFQLTPPRKFLRPILQRQRTKVDLGDGTLKRGKKNMKAYIELMVKVKRRVSKGKNDDQLVLDVFNSIDKDGKGCISVNDLRVGLMTFGVQLPLSEIKQLWREIGLNDGALIDFNTFWNAYAQESSISVLERAIPTRKSSQNLLQVRVR